jgi:hypothetical protein
VKALIDGRLESTDARSELVRLAARLIGLSVVMEQKTTNLAAFLPLS